MIVFFMLRFAKCSKMQAFDGYPGGKEERYGET